jgi:hypothetical protein
MEEKVGYRVNKKVIATHYEYLHGEVIAKLAKKNCCYICTG